jgi:hypothetical protein
VIAAGSRTSRAIPVAIALHPVCRTGLAEAFIGPVLWLVRQVICESGLRLRIRTVTP